jgi:eukaryotic-like serine/threonine-protein kinase
VLEKNPDLHSQKIFLAYCYLARGERERALGLIDDQVIATAGADQDIAYRLATTYALDKQTDKALEWLERAISMGSENYPWMSTNPNWDALRDDARFKAIMDSLKERWERLSEPPEQAT